MVGVIQTGHKTKPAPTERVINKLFLIGNGFDLALGLKTRYEDFLLWYFKKFITACLTENKSVRHSSGHMNYFFNSDELFTFYNEQNFRFSQAQIDIVGQIDSFDKIKTFIDQNMYKFSKDFNSELFKTIYNNSSKGWVDIEKIFYDKLIYELKSKGKSLDNLNADLKLIKKLLKEYLETLDYSHSQKYENMSPYLHQFLDTISPDEIIDGDDKLPIVTNQTLFLNFNYTPTVENVFEAVPTPLQSKFNSEKFKLNHIHGIINDDTNDLIFGYGDEMDNRYKEIEDLNDNRYLENFKSFKYNHSSNYRDLLRFVNSNEYQVCIYGHSCGLSDRVMLNEIFEHDNCKSIKIYYYNKEEFINKNMEISRHFNSNKLMRQRIVEFNVNDQIPQMTKE